MADIPLCQLHLRNILFIYKVLELKSIINQDWTNLRWLLKDI